jgi:ABC-type uncharacterized transport system permease subunit
MFVGFILGVLASSLVGFIFYLLSVRDLRQEAAMLRKMINTLARGLESHGIAKFNWDEENNIRPLQKGLVPFSLFSRLKLDLWDLKG